MKKAAVSHLIGICDNCNKMFEYTLTHSGVENSSYAYCARCGKTAILDVHDAHFPVDMVKSSAYKVIAAGVEPHLKPCSCGGKFSAKAAPRCPHCSYELSATRAAEYIERTPPNQAAGWRWQRNWHGSYCIVVENSQVRNNFK